MTEGLGNEAGKPDPRQFSAWVEANLIFDHRESWPAKGLWLHWTEHAEAAGVEAGTPRSFSAALARRGSPWARGCEVGRPKTRTHQGVALILPDIPKPADWAFGDDVWLNIYCEHLAFRARRYL